MILKEVGIIKKIHETQSAEEFHNVGEDKLFTSIEDLQKIEAGRVFKGNIFHLSTLPKRIKYLGYFIFCFIIVTVF